jgi:prepilin-type processing-associated H-X9-DG protein
LQNLFLGALGGDGQDLAAITDGTSHTVAISEVRTRSHEQDQRGAWALPWTGASQLAFDMHDDDERLPFRFSPLSIPNGVQPPNNTKTANCDMLYNCVDQAGAQLEKMPCLTWQTSGTLHYLSAAPRSRHPGGVQTVYLDGHVGFLSDGIDYISMAYLVCVDDGEVVSDPQ